MHVRQTKYAYHLLNSGPSARSVATATAAAVKPPPRPPGKWDNKTTSFEGEVLQPLVPNVNKWLRTNQPEPTSAASSSTSYQPNLSKWARPASTEQPRSSILRALDESSQPPRRNKPSNARSGETRRDAVGGGKWAPKFPSTSSASSSSNRPAKSSATVLDREEAPHMKGPVRTLSHLEDNETSLSANPRKSHQVDREEDPSDRNGDGGHKEEIMEMGEVSDGPGERESGVRARRPQREGSKTRGSVVERLKTGENIQIPRHSRVNTDKSNARKKKKRVKLVNPVNLDVFIPSVISVGNLAQLLGVRLETLQSCMRKNDMTDLSSYDHMLSADDASLLAMELDRNPIVDDEAAFDLYTPPPHPDYTSLPQRPPVVTIMGHVDHGKTTLLDTLRSSSVAKGEVGGITQHIGAFSVPVRGIPDNSTTPRTITFLDTPGHAAFSAMRARGAQVTDIIVLVVAADDGVMPQTKEVLDLIKKEKGKVSVVVAINKVDKPEADIEKVQNALWAEGLELEVMGGDVPSVEVSGLTGKGLDELVETISTLAEMQDIRAEAEGPAQGYILESRVQKGLGNTATVLLLRGNLTPSSFIISGTTFAKVRHLTDSTGKAVKNAVPGTAVTVSGWKELPHAGDEVLQGKEDDVKKAVDNRLRKRSLEATLSDAEAINNARRLERDRRANVDETSAPQEVKDSGPKTLRLVLKGDVSGSVEALSAAVESIGNRDAVTKVIHAGVGEVTETDVMLAKAADAMIVAFSVNVSRMANQSASQSGVTVFESKIIYSVLDEVKSELIKLLPTTLETRVTGEANVLQLFDIHAKGGKIVKVAGCRVSNGLVERNRKARVIRNGQTIHLGSLQTLRVLKRDVTEVKKGLECGMSFADFDDLREGDFVQFLDEIEKPGQL